MNWWRDALLLAGCALTIYGLWLAWRPLGVTFAGLALILLALLLAAKRT